MLGLAGDNLFFGATDTGHGDEVWITDGTEAGTRLFCEVVPGTGGSAPAAFTLVGERLLFSAQNYAYGRELWSVPLDIRARALRSPRRGA